MNSLDIAVFVVAAGLWALSLLLMFVLCGSDLIAATRSYKAKFHTGLFMLVLYFGYVWSIFNSTAELNEPLGATVNGKGHFTQVGKSVSYVVVKKIDGSKLVVRLEE